MRVFVCLLVLFAGASFAADSQGISVKDLKVDGIYAARAGDPTLYCVLGGNACIDRFDANAWNQDSLIEQWLKAHPEAIAVPISSRRWRFGKGPAKARAYLWIEDRGESLNVTLVREGHYAADAMIDMVEAEQQMEAHLPPTENQQIEKELAEMLEDDKPRRLVSDGDYSAKRQLVVAAESDAKSHQQGIWSEAGFPGRAPPQDSYMIRRFRDQRGAFEQIRALISTYPPLGAVNRKDDTAQMARNAGVPPAVVHEYRKLLVQLDANEDLNSIGGLDDVCLVVADIRYGMFGNGVIKGYVLRRDEPNPIVDDLDHAAFEAGVTRVYRRVEREWYLFELWH
jgi:endonuclease YncB( thermonuclease family)